MTLLLDLFCGAGGAAMGYHRAGFAPVGVDINPQPRYPFPFIQADALEYLAALIESGEIDEFAMVHASPPCQRYTVAQNAAQNADAHPDLVEPTRTLLIKSGLPFVIENVVGSPLKSPAVLCGCSFGLKVRRHRLFESSHFFMAPPCACRNQDYFVIFGNEVRNRRHGEKAGRKNSIKKGRAAMGIPWMTRAELSQAIPPAYTEYIGNQMWKAIGQQ